VLSRFELFVILRNQVGDRRLVRRALALEALLEELGGGERERIAALGVYVDAELCAGNAARRGEVAEELLLTEGAEAELARAVRERLGQEPSGLAAQLAVGERVVEAIYAALEAGEALDTLDARALAFHLRRAAEKRGDALAQRTVRLAGESLESLFAAALTGMRRVREDLRL
jgi:predicted hydrolase (HD superfamily)